MKRTILRLLAPVTILLVGLIWLVPWITTGRFETRTDDAYVAGRITAIAARVPGQVREVTVDDTDIVATGDLLFRLDNTEYLARFDQARAGVAAAKAARADLRAQRRLRMASIDQAKANLAASEAARGLAARTSDRLTTLAERGAATEAALDEATAGRDRTEAQVLAGKAALVAAERELEAVRTREASAEAVITQAEAALTLARIDLEHTEVHAPVGGVIAKRRVQPGQFVGVGGTQLMIVPLDDLWIEANFKETQLRGISEGDPVVVEVDSFRRRPIHGRVEGIAPGSGGAFSLFPPDNATGNFVRIVQRVPVRIALDAVPPELRLVPGMSARVAVGGDNRWRIVEVLQ